LDSFCRAADRGRFPDLNDRYSLWRLLSRITHRKVVDLVRRARSRAGQGQVVHLGSAAEEAQHANDLPQHTELPADIAVMVSEQLRHLLMMLPDEHLRAIAIAKMEGHTNAEIAERLGCAVRTVERRLSYIRSIWKEMVAR
jgi:DNA-directed RNA polymerase specialized sigma24 family protein